MPRFHCGIVGLAIALAVGVVCGGEPPEAVATILGAVGKADAATLRKARTAFDGAAEDRKREVRLGYAMALAYMQDAKFEQAAQIVDKLPAAQSKSVPIRRLRLWLAVQLKDAEQITKLFGELAADAELDAIDELSPASFGILPLEAEKERILESYRR